jgi:RecA/RadA recombinase
MAPRVKLQKRGGLYFPPHSTLEFIPSGCTLLDCMLSGGWALGRISNIVGDKSVGKTLLAIEAAANFAATYKGRIWYRESEAAFDLPYAQSLGLPIDKVDFGKNGIGTKWDTVEDVFDDLSACTKLLKGDGEPGLYIVDSLDALSTIPDLERDIRKGTFGGDKPKLLGKLFQQQAREFNSTRLHLMFISQIRDKIGVTFGRKYTRSGGKALDFYSSQTIYLAHIETLTREIGKVKRATGVTIRAKADKNKIGLPFRECEFMLRFGYGVDDLVASVDWLENTGNLSKIGITGKSKEELSKGVSRYLSQSDKLSDGEYRKRVADVGKIVRATWDDVEAGFKPKRSKYGGVLA